MQFDPVRLQLSGPPESPNRIVVLAKASGLSTSSGAAVDSVVRCISWILVFVERPLDCDLHHGSLPASQVFLFPSCDMAQPASELCGLRL